MEISVILAIMLKMRSFHFSVRDLGFTFESWFNFDKKNLQNEDFLVFATLEV